VSKIKNNNEKIIELNREIAHRERSIRSSDIINIFAILSVVFIGVWYRHGNLALMFSGKSGMFQALGAFSGLILQLALLLTVFFSSRWSYIEKVLGLDHMLVYHRVAGETAGIALIFHIAFETLNVKLTASWWDTLTSLTSTTPYMAMATVGSLFLCVIIISSLKWVRRKLTYETWYFLHLLVYAALILSFYHEIKLGIDFSFDAVARNTWIVLNLTIFGFAIISRYQNILKNVLFPIRVKEINLISKGIMEVKIDCRGLKKGAGQFMILRFMTKDLWWQPHPFSISAIEAESISFTIKNLGKGTEALGSLQPGVRVIAEGPYGRINRELLGNKKILLIAGGVGVSPIRSLLDSLTASNEPILLYRASERESAPHLEELIQKATERQGRVVPLIGNRESFSIDPFSSRGLQNLVPDLEEREVVLCGPEFMIDKAIISLLRSGVELENIHHERLWW